LLQLPLLASSFGGGTITPPSGGIIGVPQVPGIPILPPLQASLRGRR
jgi:hypothetical protein